MLCSLTYICRKQITPIIDLNFVFELKRILVCNNNNVQKKFPKLRFKKTKILGFHHDKFAHLIICFSYCTNCRIFSCRNKMNVIRLLSAYWLNFVCHSQEKLKIFFRILLCHYNQLLNDQTARNLVTQSIYSYFLIVCLCVVISI